MVLAILRLTNTVLPAVPFHIANSKYLLSLELLVIVI